MSKLPLGGNHADLIGVGGLLPVNLDKVLKAGDSLFLGLDILIKLIDVHGQGSPAPLRGHRVLGVHSLK